MKTVIIIISIIVAAGAVSLFYFWMKANTTDPLYVEFEEVKKGPFLYSITARGRTISKKMETVKSTTNGIVYDKGYQNRDFVRKGTVIASIQLDDEEYQKKEQELNLAEIDLELVQKQFQLSQDLYNAKAIPERELRQAEIQLIKQKASVNDLKKELAPKELTTSFDGMIVNKKMNHLDRVYNGTELYTIIDVNALCVELPVFQEDISKLHVGQKVIYSNESFMKTREGEITEISTVATQGNENNSRRSAMATFNVYCSIKLLPDDQTLFGSNINAEIVLEEMDSVICIPLEAVLYRENGKIVYILENGQALEKPIETGKYNDKLIEVVSGLNEGDKVITRGNLDIEDGTSITTDEQRRMENPSFFDFSNRI